jgi:hypothetical protein
MQYLLQKPNSTPESYTKYHIILVLTYLYNRRIKAQIKERSSGGSNNTKPKQGRPKIFLYQYCKKEVVWKDSLFRWFRHDMRDKHLPI